MTVFRNIAFAMMKYRSDGFMIALLVVIDLATVMQILETSAVPGIYKKMCGM